MEKCKPPEVIYLQWSPDGETTWCEDKITADDVQYVRADRVHAMAQNRARRQAGKRGPEKIY